MSPQKTLTQFFILVIFVSALLNFSSCNLGGSSSESSGNSYVSLIRGTGSPPSSMGINGEWYLDTDSGSLYEKDGGSWSSSLAVLGVLKSLDFSWLGRASSNPSGSEKMEAYFNSVEEAAFLYDGTGWIDLSGSGSSVIGSTDPGEYIELTGNFTGKNILGFFESAGQLLEADIYRQNAYVSDFIPGSAALVNSTSTDQPIPVALPSGGFAVSSYEDGGNGIINFFTAGGSSDSDTSSFTFGLGSTFDAGDSLKMFITRDGRLVMHGKGGSGYAMRGINWQSGSTSFTGGTVNIHSSNCMSLVGAELWDGKLMFLNSGSNDNEVFQHISDFTSSNAFSPHSMGLPVADFDDCFQVGDNLVGFFYYLDYDGTVETNYDLYDLSGSSLDSFTFSNSGINPRASLMDNGNVIAFWFEEGTDKVTYDLLKGTTGQSLLASSQEISPETTYSSMAPAVIDNNHFALVYGNNYGGSATTDFTVGIFDISGTLLDSHVLTSGASVSAPVQPAVTRLASGDLVVTWRDPAAEAVKYQMLKKPGLDIEHPDSSTVRLYNRTSETLNLVLKAEG